MSWLTTDKAPPVLGPLLRRTGEILAQGGSAWWVVAASAGLSGLGLYALDVALRLDAGSAVPATVLKQGVYVGIGVVGALGVSLVHYRVPGRLSWLLLAGVLGLLVFLLLPGVPTWLVKPRNGARSWIDLGPANIQPSELAKIAYVLALAWYLRYRSTHRRFGGLLPPALIAGVPMGLIILQPDLGTAILFIPVLFAVLVAAGARLKHLAIVVVIASLSLPAVYPILKPHQKARLVGLWKQVQGDTSADQDINMQSVVARRVGGAGRLAGNAEPESRQLVNFSGLPERQNDMIFAVIMNRFGLLGGLGVLGLYMAWVLGALRTAGSIREPFARLVIVGLAAFIAAQVVVNVGMNLGLLPIIGITLPFLSAGGSSMIAVWLMAGLVLGIAVRRAGMPLRRSFEYSDEDETGEA